MYAQLSITIHLFQGSMGLCDPSQGSDQTDYLYMLPVLGTWDSCLHSFTYIHFSFYNITFIHLALLFYTLVGADASPPSPPWVRPC